MQKKKSNFPPYPSDNVSQSDKKGLQWNSEWIKAVYFESSRDIVGNYDDNRRKFVNLRKYAAGKQDIDKYKPQLSLDGNTSQLNLNWNVSTPAPAIIDSLVGRLENQGLKLKIKSISPLASTEYDKEYRRLKAQALLIQKEAELNKLGVDIYESWLKKITFVDEFNNYLLLSVPTRFIRDWITSRYLDQILQIVKV
mgnify:CR=1 FL=1